MKRLVLQILPALILIAAWELCARLGLLNPLLMPSPSRILEALAGLLVSGQLWTDIGQSLNHVGIGFLLAVLLGTPIGLLIGMNRTLKALLDPPLQFLKPIPPIAWIPLAILWFGIGDAPSYFLTMVAALFPIVLNVHLGVSSISPQHFAVARCFEASRGLILRRLVWPAILPFAISGYRIGLGVAWMTVVGAEMIAAPSGLGHLIHSSQDLLQTDKVMVGMIVIGAIGLAADYGLRRLEAKLVPWK